MDYLYVAFGSACGGMLRYWLGAVVAARWGDALPWGTMLINISGSLAIGLLFGAFGQTRAYAVWVQPLLLVGMLGGFTTFSAFSLQTLQLLQSANMGGACANVLLSVVLGLAAAAGGFWLGKFVAP